MNIEESIQQIETLIEAWQLDEADLNQTDINAMQTLLKENEELKKQLENYKKLGFKHLQDKNNNLENQQKEFIEWLKAMSIMYENEYKDIDVADHYNCVLQKYKSIIGDDK